MFSIIGLWEAQMSEKWIATKILPDGNLEDVQNSLNLNELGAFNNQADIVFLPDTESFTKYDDNQLLDIVNDLNNGRVFAISDSPDAFKARNNIFKMSCSGACFPEDKDGTCWCICSRFIGGKYYWVKCHEC